MPSRQEILKMKARYVANPLDYKKVIVERSFAKDWKPNFRCTRSELTIELLKLLTGNVES
eukprot:SAG11_NODE_84_length_17377_cov_78.572578_4_plen_60_part_00